MDVSENSGTPKSSILIGFSIINHPFWSTPIFGNIQMVAFHFSFPVSYRGSKRSGPHGRPRSQVGTSLGAAPCGCETKAAALSGETIITGTWRRRMETCSWRVFPHSTAGGGRPFLLFWCFFCWTLQVYNLTVFFEVFLVFSRMGSSGTWGKLVHYLKGNLGWKIWDRCQHYWPFPCFFVLTDWHFNPCCPSKSLLQTHFFKNCRLRINGLQKSWNLFFSREIDQDSGWTVTTSIVDLKNTKALHMNVCIRMPCNEGSGFSSKNNGN